MSQGFMDALFQNVEKFISTKTVFGEAKTFGDVTLIPIMELTFGLGGANTKANEKKGNGENGGMGGKLSVTAIICIQNGTVTLLNIKNQDSINKVIDMAPSFLNNISSFFKKDGEEAACPLEPSLQEMMEQGGIQVDVFEKPKE